MEISTSHQIYEISTTTKKNKIPQGHLKKMQFIFSSFQQKISP